MDQKIEQINEDKPQPLPYMLEGKPGRFTKITTEQRRLDTHEYVKEVKQRLRSMTAHDLEINPELLFMHESVFEEGDNQPALLAPETKARKLQWWEDEEALAEENITDPDGKIKRYLNGSKQDYDTT